jgi:membrane protein
MRRIGLIQPRSFFTFERIPYVTDVMPKQLLRILSFLRFVIHRFNEGRCVQIASSLTYTTLLSLVPLITIALTVIAAFPVFTDLSIQLKVFILTHLVPEAAGKVITGYMFQFSENAARLTAVGIAFLAVTALMLILTIDRAFNSIWRVSRQRPLLARLLVYWAVLTLGPVMIGGSLSLTSYLVSLSLGWVSHLPSASVVVLKVIPVVLTTGAFALMYVTIPNRFVPFWHALTGGVVAGLAFAAMQKLFTLYITHFGSFKLVYGTFASIPIFLLWIYLSWLVILLGAVIAASLSHWRGGAWQIQRTPGRQFYDALRILRVLWKAHSVGEAVNLRALRRIVHAGLDDLEEILVRLRDVGWVRRVEGKNGGWVLVKDPEEIHVVDVFHLFVFETEGTMLPANAGDGKLDGYIHRVMDSIDSGMLLSLRSLYDEAAPDAS